MFLATHGVLRRSSAFVPPVFADTYSFEYDGVADYLEGTTTYSELDGVSKASFSMWLKPTTSSGRLRTVFQIGDGSASDVNGVCQLFLFENSRIDFSVDSGTFFGRADISGVTYGSWNHLLITVDFDADPEFKCYVNGVDATTSDNMSTKTAFTNATQGLMIGEWHTGKYAPFLGGIDEFAIWSGVALTSTDVASIYNSGVPNNLNDSSIVTTAPTTWLRADSSTWDGSRWTVDDENSSYQLESNNMTSASRSTDVPLFDNKSFEYDGVSDYLEIADSDSLSFGNGSSDSPFSISTWVNMTDASVFRILSKYTSSAQEYLLATDSTDKIVFSLYDDSTGGRLSRKYNTALTSLQGQWIHLTATYDGTTNLSGLKIYLNGSQVDDANNQSGTYDSMENTSQIVEIGKLTTTNANGMIDETSIFDYELTSANVSTIYGSGVPTDISSLNPVGHWRAENGSWDGSKWTITDSGSGGNDAESVSMTLASRTSDVPT